MTVAPASIPVRVPPFAVRRVLFISSLAALCGGVVLAIGATQAPRQAAFSYLAAYAFATSTALGALFFLMIGHAMNATWPVALRRLTESMAATLPILFLLFLPVALGISGLYPWTAADGEHAGVHDLVARKRAYLNVPFFLARTIFYFAVWGCVTTLLVRWSRAQDAEPEHPRPRRLTVLSSAALPAVALCTVFAAIDWLMSLTPEWYSTMFGVYFFAGGFQGALALLTLMTALLGAPGRILAAVVNSAHLYALGRLLFAFTVFWAYIAFFQFFIIYVADRPDEAAWYVVRRDGSWGGVGALLAIGRFIVPFTILLSYDVKRNARALAVLSGCVLFFHFLDAYWLVMPALHERGVVPHVFDLAALLFVVGTTVAFAAVLARRAAAAPINDPLFPSAIRYDSR